MSRSSRARARLFSAVLFGIVLGLFAGGGLDRPAQSGLALLVFAAFAFGIRSMLGPRAALATASDRLRSAERSDSEVQAGKEQAWPGQLESTHGNHDRKMEILERFAEGITHEINNLMTVVTINAELLQSRVEHEGTDLLARILDATNQATSLSRRLFAFTQQADPVCIEVDLNEEVAVLERLVRPLLGEFVELELVRCPDLAKIEADPSEIGRLVVHSIVSAKDLVATSGRIVVETFNTTVREHEPCHTGSLEPGSYSGLRVSGPEADVAAEALSRIVEPCFSDEDSAASQGLAMVGTLSIRSGGGVRILSSPSRGVCFEVLLPAAAGTRKPLFDPSALDRVASGGQGARALQA